MPYLSAASCKVMCDALVDSIDSGGAGTMQIRSGTRPANADAAATGTLLATVTFSATSFGAATSARPSVATAASITQDSSADNTGTASWARVLNGSAATIKDLSVGTSGAEVNLDSVSIVAGGSVSITSMTVTMPDGT